MRNLMLYKMQIQKKKTFLGKKYYMYNMRNHTNVNNKKIYTIFFIKIL